MTHQASNMRDEIAALADDVVSRAVRATLDGLVEVFEESARDDVLGEDATITYRDLIRILRQVGPQVSA